MFRCPFRLSFPIGKRYEITDYESWISKPSYISSQRHIHLLFVAAYTKAAQTGVQIMNLHHA